MVRGGKAEGEGEDELGIGSVVLDSGATASRTASDTSTEEEEVVAVVVSCTMTRPSLPPFLFPPRPPPVRRRTREQRSRGTPSVSSFFFRFPLDDSEASEERKLSVNAAVVVVVVVLLGGEVAVGAAHANGWSCGEGGTAGTNTRLEGLSMPTGVDGSSGGATAGDVLSAFSSLGTTSSPCGARSWAWGGTEGVAPPTSVEKEWEGEARGEGEGDRVGANSPKKRCEEKRASEEREEEGERNSKVVAVRGIKKEEAWMERENA